MSKKRYPFGVSHVSSGKVASADASIDDHMSKRYINTTCWLNGEGFTLNIQEGKRDESIQISWTDWSAMKLCVKELLKKDMP